MEENGRVRSGYSSENICICWFVFSDMESDFFLSYLQYVSLNDFVSELLIIKQTYLLSSFPNTQSSSTGTGPQGSADWMNEMSPAPLSSRQVHRSISRLVFPDMDRDPLWYVSFKHCNSITEYLSRHYRAPSLLWRLERRGGATLITRNCSAYIRSNSFFNSSHRYLFLFAVRSCPSSNCKFCRSTRNAATYLQYVRRNNL